VTWYRHAVAYAEMKWPHLAPHSRASLADALATVTPLLTRKPGPGRQRRYCAASCTGMPSTPGGALALPGLPAGQPARRPARHPGCLDGLCTRLDGSLAAASTITRKRAVFHGALGYAVELGLLPANPTDLVSWRGTTLPPPPPPAACKHQPNPGLDC
jgi:hypothetical protein